LNGLKARITRWFDGLHGRIAAALFIALAVQFVGSDIIFEQIEAGIMERGRAQRLADWLCFAEEFVDSRPDADERMTRLWQPDLMVSHRLTQPVFPGQYVQDARVEQLVRIARPQLVSRDFRAFRDGQDIVGSIHLPDGHWIAFRSQNYFAVRTQLLRYVYSALLLLICVVLIVLLFGRMIGRPLAQIAEAAEHVGEHDDAVPIAVEGPWEVRQVATAFDRMQSRLLTQLNDRLQSVAAMSHDLRTPLARLRLNAATVEGGETRLALQHDVAEMENCVSSVLEYLRGEEPEPEQRADIASIAMTVVEEERDAGNDAEYTGPDRLEAVTRPFKLKRLVRNVVQNATRHAGSARVSIEARANATLILVDDDGPGIPPGMMEAVFEPFRRIESSRNRGTGGSGLGLAISRRLADRLGGTIELRNRSTGGLRVTICLPVACTKL